MSLRSAALLVPFLAVAATAPALEDSSSAAVRGRRVYLRACASCHGRSGRGDGPAATSLDPRPRDFTSGKYKFRSTPTGSPATGDDLYRTVTYGIPRTYMVAWKDLLSERDRRDVVQYLQTLSETSTADAAPVAIPEASPASPESVAEGKSLYMIMQCFSCHGSEGRGDGPSAGSLRDDWGRPIDAFDFTVGAYKGGDDAESVFRTFETGLNGTPMPSYADAFLFDRESVRPDAYRDAYPEAAVEALGRYLSTQPSRAELAGMSDRERANLVARRKWSLVHYVRSLTREPGPFHWLFVGDTELAR